MVADAPNPLKSDMILALRRFARTVMVISCAHQGERFAMSATAVSEVSVEPPSMLICINRGTKIFPALSVGERFCINMLHAGQADIARNCGGLLSGEHRFSAGNWTDDAYQTPYLRDAQANFFCENKGGNSIGTHDIFIGEISTINIMDRVDPLIYVDGIYQPIILPSGDYDEQI